MAYQSLYRRYRPRNFGEVVGQQHVVTALRNAVREGQAGHAYLFSGPRGTGKTSIARILAKALNCTEGSDGEPCGHCESCRAMESGASYDLHELDAASNNGVDAMRDLIAKAALGSPGRTKVYILDEVHMLSTAASNALLKTLEEPPAHVTFVLATTDPQRVLATIRSRAQHFEFGLIPAADLQRHVRHVIADAGLELDDEAVAYALRKGGGSARDTLSALDQVAALGGQLADEEPLDDLVDALVARSTAGALSAVAAALGAGREPRVLGEQLLGQLRDAFLVVVGAPADHLPEDERARAGEAGRQLGPAAVTRALEALGEALVEMRQAPDPRVPLEVALVRMTRPELDTGLAALVERVTNLERQLVAATGGPPTAGAPPTVSSPAASSSGPAPPASDRPAAGPTLAEAPSSAERPAALVDTATAARQGEAAAAATSAAVRGPAAEARRRLQDRAGAQAGRLPPSANGAPAAESRQPAGGGPPSAPFAERRSPSGSGPPSAPASESRQPTAGGPRAPVSESRQPSGGGLPSAPVSESREPTGGGPPSAPIAESREPTGSGPPSAPIAESREPTGSGPPSALASDRRSQSRDQAPSVPASESAATESPPGTATGSRPPGAPRSESRAAPSGRPPNAPAGASPDRDPPLPDATNAEDGSPADGRRAPELPALDELRQAWGQQVFDRLAMPAKARYRAGRFLAVDDGVATFGLPNSIHRDRCEEKRPEVEAALAAHFGHRVPLRLVVDEAAADPSLPGAAGLRAPFPTTSSAASASVTMAVAADAGDDDEDLALADVHALPDANDVASTVVDRLLQAFPGSEVLE